MPRDGVALCVDVWLRSVVLRGVVKCVGVVFRSIVLRVILCVIVSRAMMLNVDVVLRGVER